MFRGKKSQGPAKAEVFDIDLPRGVIERKLDGTRVMALSSQGWTAFQTELQSTFMSGGTVILQRLGYSYGRSLGQAIKNAKIPPDQAFAAMQSLAQEGGWGEMTLSTGDLTTRESRISVRGCFFCLHSRDSTEPICNILVGLVGGMLDVVFGGNHRVSEGKCIGKGDAVCEIQIELPS
jgi:predicted hydrocarbon binding protein